MIPIARFIYAVWLLRTQTSEPARIERTGNRRSSGRLFSFLQLRGILYASVFYSLCAGISHAATLSGTVSYPDGTPAANVRVEAMVGQPVTPLSEIWNETTTDSRGKYRIECIAGRVYFIRALDLVKIMVSQGRPGMGVAVESSEQGTIQDLKLEPRTITRVRVVTDGDTAQLNGSVWANTASIYLRWYRPEFYIDGLSLGLNQISVRESAHGPVDIEFEVVKNKLNHAEARFTPGGTIDGITVDENGSPVAGVLLHLGDRGNRHSGPDGQFRIVDMTERKKPVGVNHPGYLPMEFTVLPEHRTKGMRIVLRRSTRTIRGRIVNSAPDSIRDMIVCAYPKWVEELPTTSTGQRATNAMIGPDMRFVIGPVDTGVYRVVVRAKHRTGLFALTPGKGDVDLGDIQLAPEGSLRGKIVDAMTELPIKKFSVSCMNWGLGRSVEVDNDSGTFTAPAPFRGVNECYIRAPGYLPANIHMPFPSEKSEASVIPISRAASLLVTTVCRGAPVSDIHVALFEPGNSTGIAGRATDSTGKVTFTRLRPGRYKYLISGVEQGWAGIMEEVNVDSIVELTIEMVRGLSIDGTVEEADGTPCTGLLVAANPDPNDPPAASFFHNRPAAVQDGKFRLDGLAHTGKVTLQVLLPWTQSTKWSPLIRVDNVAPGTRGLRIVLGSRRIIRILAHQNGVQSTTPLLIRTIACADSISSGYNGRENFMKDIPPTEFTGEYLFGAAAGTTCLIRIDGPNVAPNERIICPEPGADTLTLVFDLKQSRRFEGIVTGALRKAPLTAVIPVETNSRYRPERAQVDQDGRFTIYNVPAGQFPLLLVTRENSGAVYAGCHMATGDGKPVQIASVGRVPVSGKVRNISCIPATERVATLALRQWPDITVCTAPVSSNGAFSIDSVPAGSYVLWIGRGRCCAAVRVDGTGAVECSPVLPDSASFPRIIVTQTAKNARGTLTMSRGGFRMQAVSGEAAALVPPGILSEENEISRVLEMGPVPVGKGDVSGVLRSADPAALIILRSEVNAARGYPRITVSPRKTSLVVTCADSSGAPVGSARVFISSASAPPFSLAAKGNPDERIVLTNRIGDIFEATGTTGRDGILRVQGLAPGTWRICILHPELASVPCTVHVDTAQVSKLPLRLTRCGHTQYRAAQTDGTPINELRCTVLDTIGYPIGALSATGLPGGRAAVGFSLHPGSYQVVTEAPTMVPVVERITVFRLSSSRTAALKPCGWLDISGSPYEVDSLLLGGPGKTTYRVPQATRGSVISPEDSRGNSLLISGLAPGEYQVITKRARSTARIRVGQIAHIDLKGSGK